LPNKTVVFLSRDEALEIHRVLLERFGGPAGLRDTGLLERALYRAAPSGTKVQVHPAHS
jgi:hypothetical protein